MPIEEFTTAKVKDYMARVRKKIPHSE